MRTCGFCTVDKAISLFCSVPEQCTLAEPDILTQYFVKFTGHEHIFQVLLLVVSVPLHCLIGLCCGQRIEYELHVQLYLHLE